MPPKVTRAEFNAWLTDYHGVLFPEVTQWLDQSATENPAHEEIILAAWFHAVRWNTLDDLYKATEKFVAGEAEHPRLFDMSRFPAALKQAMPFGHPPGDILKKLRYDVHAGTLTEVDS